MKKILYSGLAALFLFSASCGTIPSKKWVEDRINNSVAQYEQKDKKWTREMFQEEVNQEQLMEAYNSAYLVINMMSFKTKTNMLLPSPATGSGILFKGGYLLTARHVVDVDLSQFEGLTHPLFGPVTYSHNSLFMSKQGLGKSDESYNLEKIISGEKEGLDYSLLKVKEEGLPCYTKGLNLPDKVDIGMQTIAIGYPLGMGKNVRLGNISQLDSDIGEFHITYRNNVYQSDSGGPLFLVEDGNVKLLAISRAIIQDPQTGAPYNINYGLKVSEIVKDMESRLESGKLDEKTAEEVRNFLNLNKK